MEKIILSALLHLLELLAEYALTDYDLVDLSVDNDEQVYLLLAREVPARIQGRYDRFDTCPY